MKKTVFFIALVALALGFGWYIFTDGAMSLEAAKNKLVREAQDAVIKGSTPEEVAALAVKTINMTQGEKGIELWRLKADWGNMRRNDDILELEKPKFTYYMPPDNAEIRIVSMKGEIDQSDQKIKFVDSVVATLDDRTVNSSLAVYHGKSKEMIFPQGAFITGAGLDGKADRIVWRLDEKVIVATGNVDMTFENDKDIFAPQEKNGGASPATEGAKTESQG